MSYENEKLEVNPKPIKKKRKVVYAEQSHTTTLLLAFFLGGWGAHRFYTGHTALAIVMILTLGGCGIWTIIDIIRICFNNFKTADGLPLREYNKTLGMTFFFVYISIIVLNLIIGSVGLIEFFASAMKGVY